MHINCKWLLTKNDFLWVRGSLKNFKFVGLQYQKFENQRSRVNQLTHAQITESDAYENMPKKCVCPTSGY